MLLLYLFNHVKFTKFHITQGVTVTSTTALTYNIYKNQNREAKLNRSQENLELQSRDSFKDQVLSLNQKVENIQKQVGNLQEQVSKNINKLWDDFNIYSPIENIKDYFFSYTNFFDTHFSYYDQVLLFNILSAVLLLMLLFSTLMIFFSQYLIDRFKLSIRYPKLAKLLEYRKKFQTFYLYSNLFFSLFTILSIIIINIYVLI
uniref:hypothetical protein n=1 Tax=Poriella subacida TaxID=2872513 RepID=UPI0030014CC2|nr:hypothetical protein [Poriella subacida]